MKTITSSNSFFHWAQTVSIQSIMRNVKKFLILAEKKKSFMQHYQQIDGAIRNNKHPIDISKRASVTYFSVIYLSIQIPITFLMMKRQLTIFLRP